MSYLKSRQTAVQWPAICVAFVLVILKHLQNTPNIHPQLLRQLAGIGNNTNQVARQINYRIASGGELNSTDVVELERYFGEILEQLIAIRQQYSQVGNEHVS